MSFASGWANNCGTELFTIGWVPCETDVIGGGSSKSSDRIYNQARREDDEILLIIEALADKLM